MMRVVSIAGHSRVLTIFFSTASNSRMAAACRGDRGKVDDRVGNV
jgi:hypothetical protein